MLGLGSSPIQLARPVTHTDTQQTSSNSAMDHLSTVRPTPLDCTKTSEGDDSTSESQSGTSFSLKDKLRSIGRKSTPSSSTTHHVTLNGLKSNSQAEGTSYSFLMHQIE